MSIAEQADLRPPRETERLKLPVPGDAGPADYVTDTGTLADAVDAAAAKTAPLVTALPDSPDDGDEVYFDVAAGPPGVRIAWHLRYSGAWWDFLGGPPRYSEAADGAVITSPAYSSEWSPAYITIPLTGFYLVRLGAAFNFHGVAGQDGVATGVLQDMTAGRAYLAQGASVVGGSAGGGGASVSARVQEHFDAGHELGLIFNTVNQPANLQQRWMEVAPIGGLT
jgi:hypothetical protein